jgi:hypothetical protein
VHEQQRLAPKKINYSWLSKENWWLCYVEQMEVFAATPSVRLKGDAVNTHSKSKLHSTALESEMLQRVFIL